MPWSTNWHQIGTAVQKGKGIPYVSLSRIASFQSENHHSNIVFLHQMERSFLCGLKKENILLRTALDSNDVDTKVTSDLRYCIFGRDVHGNG